MPKPFDYIVLGAGISGLSLAYFLQQQGKTLMVLEKNKQVGGNISSIPHENAILEAGPNTVQMKHPVVLKLLQDLGLEDQIVYPDQKAQKRYILHPSKGPVGLENKPQKIFFSPLLNWKDRFKIMGETRRSKHPINASPSIDEFFRYRFGHGVADFFVNPFVAGIYAGDPKKLSLRYAFPSLWEMEQEFGSIIKGMKAKKTGAKPIFTLKGGMATWVKKLAEHVPHRCQAEVLGIEKNEDCWQVNTDSESLSCKQLISTIPLESWNLLAPEFALPTLRRPPLRIEFWQGKTQQWKYPGFGCLVPEKTPRNYLGVLFNHQLFPQQAPGIMTVFVGGDRQAEVLQGEQVWHAELKKDFGLDDSWKVIHQVDYPMAIPQYEHQAMEKLLGAIEALESKEKGLHFFGNFKHGIAVPDLILQAQKWAEEGGKSVG